MREYTGKPKNTSRTLDSTPRANRQASINEVLQTYNNGNQGNVSAQRKMPQSSDLIQCSFVLPGDFSENIAAQVNIQNALKQIPDALFKEDAQQSQPLSTWENSFGSEGAVTPPPSDEFANKPLFDYGFIPKNTEGNAYDTMGFTKPELLATPQENIDWNAVELKKFDESFSDNTPNPNRELTPPLTIKDYPIFYEGKVAPFTTVGFEHEFTNYQNKQLTGKSHVIVAKSQLKMPYTDLGFHLETDNKDKLELVSPPFLMETSGSPVPKARAVIEMNNKMTQYLTGLRNQKEVIKGCLCWKKIVKENKTLLDMVTEMNSNLGINMQILPQIRIPGKNAPDNFKHSKMTVGDPVMNVQVNFATDAQSYDRILQKNLKFAAYEGQDREFQSAYLDLCSLFTPQITEDANNGIFWRQLVRSISQMLIYPAEDVLKNFKSKVGQVAITGPRSDDHTILKRLCEGRISFVKDVGRIWLKSDLSDFAHGGELNAELLELQFNILTANLDSVNDKLNEHNRYDSTKFPFINNNYKLPQYDFKKEIENLINSLRSGGKKKGVRSDTYLPPIIENDKKAKYYKDKHLFVAELRPGGVDFEYFIKNIDDQSEKIKHISIQKLAYYIWQEIQKYTSCDERAIWFCARKMIELSENDWTTENLAACIYEFTQSPDHTSNYYAGEHLKNNIELIRWRKEYNFFK